AAAARPLHRAAGRAAAAPRGPGRRHRRELLHRRDPLREGGAVDACQRHGQRAAARRRHPGLFRIGRRHGLRRPLLRVRRTGGAGCAAAAAGRRRGGPGAGGMSWFVLALAGAYWLLAPWLGWPTVSELFYVLGPDFGGRRVEEVLHPSGIAGEVADRVVDGLVDRILPPSPEPLPGPAPAVEPLPEPPPADAGQAPPAAADAPQR